MRFGDRAVLVGATQERITQLLTVDDPEEFKRLTETPEDDVDSTPARTRAGSAVSLLGTVRTGFQQMRARQSEMNARLKAQRAAARGNLDAGGDTTPARRFGALKGVLSRPAKPAARTSEEIITEAEEARQSLFDRALASIDAIEVAGDGSPLVVDGASIAAGPRARASYGAANRPAAPMTTPMTAPTTAAARAEQIAELQRAIAAARKTAS